MYYGIYFIFEFTKKNRMKQMNDSTKQNQKKNTNFISNTAIPF